MTQLDHRNLPDALRFQRNERNHCHQRQYVQRCHQVEVAGEIPGVKSKCEWLRRVLLKSLEVHVGQLQVVPCGEAESFQSEEGQFKSASEEEQRQVRELAQHGHFQSDDFLGEDADQEGHERQDADSSGQTVQHAGLSVLVFSVKLADQRVGLVRSHCEEVTGVGSGGEVRQSESRLEVHKVDVQFHVGLFDVAVVRENDADLRVAGVNLHWLDCDARSGRGSQQSSSGVLVQDEDEFEFVLSEGPDGGSRKSKKIRLYWISKLELIGKLLFLNGFKLNF